MIKNIILFSKIALFSLLIVAPQQIKATASTASTTESSLSEEEKLIWLRDTLGGARFEAKRVAAFIGSVVVENMVLKPLCQKIASKWINFEPTGAIKDLYPGAPEIPIFSPGAYIYVYANIAANIAAATHSCKNHGVEKKTAILMTICNGSILYAICHELFLGYHVNLNNLLKNYEESSQDIPSQFKATFDQLAQEYAKDGEITSMNKGQRIKFVAKTIKQIQARLDQGDY